MRTFFCIELEDELKGKLNAIIRALKQRCAARVNWVRQENLHITVKFLGEVAPERLEALRAAAELALDGAGLEPFEILLDRLGAFPELTRPRVIWVGSSSPPPQLQKLHEALERRLEGLGFPREEKPYTPHITLGRVKELQGAAVAELAQRLRALEPFQFSARASELTLMESQLTPQGSIYRPLFRLGF